MTGSLFDTIEPEPPEHGTPCRISKSRQHVPAATKDGKRRCVLCLEELEPEPLQPMTAPCS